MKSSMSCAASGAHVSCASVWTHLASLGTGRELWWQRLSVGDLAAHAHAAVPADQAVESSGALLIGRGLCPEHDAGEERGALEEAGVDLALGEQPLLLGRTLGCRAA